MSLILLALFTTGTAVSEPVIPSACPIGAALQLRSTPDPRLAGAKPHPSFVYRDTRRIDWVADRCIVALRDLDPNSSAARFADGSGAWFRDWGKPALVVHSLESPPGAEGSNPGIVMDRAARCDRRAIDSTTFGPFNSCAALIGKPGRMRLRIVHRGPTSGKTTDIALPDGGDYIGLTAGTWLHAVSGEVTLIRRTSKEQAVADIFTLFGA